VLDGGVFGAWGVSESSTSLYLCVTYKRRAGRSDPFFNSVRKAGIFVTSEGRLEDQFLEVSLDDHVLDRGHRNFQKIGIRGIGEMRINFPARTSIQSHELVHKVFACLFSAAGIAMEIGEAEFGDWAVLDLGLEYVHLIQEKDQSRILEPMGIGNRLPQHQSFLHLILQRVSIYLTFPIAQLTPSLSSAKH
jgi:hypothetical protein